MNATSKIDTAKMTRLTAAVRSIEASLVIQSQAIAGFHSTMNHLDDSMQKLGKNMKEVDGAFITAIKRTSHSRNEIAEFKSAA